LRRPTSGRVTDDQGGGLLQPQVVGLAPVDIETFAAAVAPHRAGASVKWLALAATGTHGVAVAPARRQPHGIVRARHDGPAAWWGFDDLEKGGGPAPVVRARRARPA